MDQFPVLSRYVKYWRAIIRSVKLGNDLYRSDTVDMDEFYQIVLYFTFLVYNYDMETLQGWPCIIQM